MRVQAGGPSAAASGPSRASGASGDGFSIEAQGLREAAPAGPAAPLGALSSLDALLALQEAQPADERRRRAVKRGGRMLDALDLLKLSLLGGGSDEEAHRALATLRESLAEDKDGFEDPGLSAVLTEIDTRAAVELAKLEGRRTARA